MIVLPGLVETHWHMWNTLLRSMAVDERKFGYFPTSAGLGQHYLPSDMYQGTRLSAAEALNSGITFVHDWCHNPRTPEHAEENLRALRESGIRARFSYGPARGIPVSQAVNIADIERLHGAWSSYSNDGLLSLGLAWRGVQYAVTGADGKMAFQPIPPEVYRKEYETARHLDIPLTAHVNIGPKIDFGHVAALAKLDLLYRDLQLIHMISSTPEEIDLVAAAGSSVSFSPYTEMRTGFGFPKASAYLEKGIRVGLSVDTTTLSGDADMFAIMKAIENIENGLAYSEFKMTARKALELGTIMGARSMGIDNRVGSLTPGKRADLIMVSTRDINLAMFTDPSHLVVGATQPANVDLVMVDGRILKRNRKLVHLDLQVIAREAAAANAALRKRAGWW
jgi:cytosine/adenosine deaminase-related metal-dependent hydrolase